MRMHIYVVVLVLLSSGPALARQSKQNPPRGMGKLIKQADKLIQQHRIDEALLILEQTSQQDPGNLEALLRLGICYSLKKDYKNSQASFEAGLNINPKEPRLLHNMGLLFYKQHQFDRALSYFLKTVKVRPWHPDSNFYIGLIYQNRDERDQALHYYIQELNHNPNNLKALERLDLLKQERQLPGSSSKVPLALLIVIWVLALMGVALLKWQAHRRQAARLQADKTEKQTEGQFLS